MVKSNITRKEAADYYAANGPLETYRHICGETWADSMRQNIPPRMQDGVLRYVIFGIKPGDFLCGVFKDSLRSTFAYADEINTLLVRQYAQFVYNSVPATCVGVEQFEYWLARGGIFDDQHGKTDT